MTLIIALRCADGVIMASDSQFTQGQTTFNAEKIFSLGSRAMWGAAGALNIFADIRGDAPSVETVTKDNLDTNEIGHRFTRRAKPIYERYMNNVPVVGGQRLNYEWPVVVAAGYTVKSVPWIVAYDLNCVPNRFESNGFIAVGSGTLLGQTANELLAHYQVPQYGTDYGMRVAFRVMDMAISLAGPLGVGGAIQMWAADRQGARRLAQAELDEIAAHVDQWKDLEKETLLTLLQGPTTEDKQKETPPPPEA